MAYKPYCQPKDPKPNPYGSKPEDEPVAAPPLPEAVDTIGNTDAVEAEEPEDGDND